MPKGNSLGSKSDVVRKRKSRKRSEFCGRTKWQKSSRKPNSQNPQVNKPLFVIVMLDQATARGDHGIDFAAPNVPIFGSDPIEHRDFI